MFGGILASHRMFGNGKQYENVRGIVPNLGYLVFCGG